ncbi:MAG: metalloregulator ArsR/SmtB family transcription factor [Haloarculaceae archaeon]
MSQTTERLRRLLADELGQSRPEDLEDRLAELDDLEESTPIASAPSDTRVFGALGSETRYRLMRFLLAAAEELCVCELTPLVDVSDSAVSHALSELVDAGLATRRKEGRWHYYDATERATAILEAFDATAGEQG